jgi:hypothetical protein
VAGRRSFADAQHDGAAVQVVILTERSDEGSFAYTQHDSAAAQIVILTERSDEGSLAYARHNSLMLELSADYFLIVLLAILKSAH